MFSLSKKYRTIFLLVVMLSATFLFWRQKRMEYHPSVQPDSYEYDETTITAEAIDRKYCGGPCRFMLPVDIREQESKAQEHFRQLAFLTGHVDRIVVLPNVGGSRLGACQKHDFTHYYSSTWATDHRWSFRHITMANFVAWMNERAAVSQLPTAQRLYMLGLNQDIDMFTKEYDQCLEGRLKMTLPDQRLHMIDNLRNQKNIKAIANAAIEFLTSPGTIDVEVQAIYYNKRRPLLPDLNARHTIPYSEAAFALVEQIIKSHFQSSFWAVHWRTENLPNPSSLVPCARSLVEHIQDRTTHLTPESQPAILLLTDYPHTFTEQQITQAMQGIIDPAKPMIPTSSSFDPSTLTPFHHQAMHHLYQNMTIHVSSLQNAPLGSPKNWVVFTIPSAVSRDDPGFLGIIDKLLAIRANVFLAGAHGECARQSSFTRQIVGVRSRDDRLENVIDLFYSSYIQDKDTKDLYLGATGL